MIKNTEPLSMVEVSDYIKKNKDIKDKKPDIRRFIKKFSKLSSKEVQELKKELTELGLMKVNEKHISKVIDLMPENSEELNKIFSDVSLDEDEIQKILETVKKFQ